MSLQILFGIIIVAFAIGLLLSWLYPTKVERWYDRAENGRKVIGLILLLLLAGTAIQSGDPKLMFATVIAVFLLAIYFAVEKPHEELV